MIAVVEFGPAGVVVEAVRSAALVVPMTMVVAVAWMGGLKEVVSESVPYGEVFICLRSACRD